MGNRRYIEENPAPAYYKEWREFRGLTQSEVEKLYGWPASRVSNIEKGRAIVTDHVLRALARAYRCTIGDLVDRPPAVANNGDGAASGLPALHQALVALDRLAAEANAIRSEIGQRIDDLEANICAARDGIGEAMRESSELAEALQQAAGQFSRVIGRTRDGDAI